MTQYLPFLGIQNLFTTEKIRITLDTNDAITIEKEGYFVKQVSQCVLMRSC